MPVVTQEIFDHICDMIASGKSLREAARSEGIPESTIRYQIVNDPDMTARYTRAREAQGDAHFDSVVEIADEVRRGDMDPQAARVAIDALKWTAGRMRPKVYGDKLAIGGADDLPPVRTIDATRLSDDALRQIMAATDANPETDAG